jgi:Zn ribbon nucleic-acid-binding protein
MTKGIIICKKHGEFLQSPNSHLRGNGCPKCHLGSTEEFIERSKKIHGNTYNYSKFVYVHSLIKGIIICKIHGEFLQTPNSHVHGAGCPKCYGINLSNDEHVEKFKLVHKDKYDYSLVNYINNKTKVKIICKYHGIFLQTPDNHLSNQGCPKCGIENAKRPKTLNNKIFIDQSIKIHGNIYDYSLVDYKNYKTKVKIICKIHNKIFYQTPGSHLSGSGCPICSESNGEKKIRVFLEKNNIKYKNQKIFDTCRNFLTNHKLRYDFYLYDYNLLIEYDGKGHFAITRFKGISLKNATKSYNLIKITDKIKNTIFT